jgi:hypothetical protein
MSMRLARLTIIVSSPVSSHLFDFMHARLYVLGVGVVGGVILRRASIESKTVGASLIGSDIPRVVRKA